VYPIIFATGEGSCLRGTGVIHPSLSSVERELPRPEKGPEGGGAVIDAYRV
jgi:hypothetical protein